MARLLPVLVLVVFLTIAAPAAAEDWDRLLAPAGTCQPNDGRDASARRQERAMRCMVDHARRARGLGRLHRARPLARAARRKAGDILRCGFSHTACGHPFTFHMQATGYAAGCYGAGENIAWGSGALGTVRATLRAWLHSDGHRATLLSPRFRDQGIGLRRGRMGGRPGAAVWVHEFGYRC